MQDLKVNNRIVKHLYTFIKLIKKLIANTFTLLREEAKEIYLINLKSQHFEDNENKKKKELAKRIKKLHIKQTIIKHNLDKLSSIYRFIALTISALVLIFLVIRFYGKVDQTEIFADIVIKEMFITSSTNISEENAPVYIFPTRDSLEINVVNAPNNYPLNSQFVNLDTAGRRQLAIQFTLPNRANLLIDASVLRQLNLKILPSTSDINFQFSVIGKEFQLRTDTISTAVKEIVYFPHKKIEKNQEVNMTLYNPETFEFTLPKLDNIFFHKIDNGKETSLIQRGSIRLRDTNDDSITLFSEDRLYLNPTHPIKALISKLDEGLRIQFTSTVSKLAVLSVDGSEEKNFMPSKIKATYDKSPYIWLIIITSIPSIFGFFKRRI